MTSFWMCLRDQHDHRLILLAGLVCMVGALCAVLLMRQARDSWPERSTRWVAVAGLTAGFTIWATHFIAMLGYLPGAAIGFRPGPTLASLSIAAISTWLGFSLALRFRQRAMQALGAVAVGMGISGMHYVGMMALALPMRIALDWHFVALSLIFSVAPLYPAMILCLDGHGYRSSLKAASLACLAVLLLHFTGVAAIRLTPQRLSVNDGLILSTQTMAAAIAVAALIVVANCLIVLITSRRNREAIHASERDFALLARGISDYALYMLTLDGHIANWNAGAQRLLGYDEAEVVGRHVSIFHTPTDRARGTPAKILTTALESGKYTGEGWRRRRDGSSFWAHFSLELIADADGRPIGLAKITRDMTRLKEDQDRLERLTAQLDTALDNMHLGLCLLDARHRLVLHNRRFAQMWELDEEDLPAGLDLDLLCARALASRLTPPLHDGGHGQAMAAMMCQAVRSADAGPTIGEFDENLVLSIVSRTLPDGGLVATFEDITDRRRSEARIAYLASHDALTDLPNRARFSAWMEAELARAHAQDKHFALIAFDLNSFKEVNDLRGQAVGDRVMVELAARLNAVLHEGEMVARLAGDEFAAGKQLTGDSDLDVFVGRLAACFDQPFDSEETPIVLTARFGIAVAPLDAETPEALLNNADLAAQRAKASVAGNIAYYESGMDRAARTRRQIAADLRMAIVRDEFHLLYQPQHRVATGDLTGYEALIRWNHSRLGVVSPDVFIPVAEETGEIIAIGQWVLRRACNDAAGWPDDLSVAVNLSAIQLMQPDLVRHVAQILIDSGLPARRLVLEITESAIIADKARALHVLRQIKALGISIAMDDFGTGYSSLDTLHAFPFDKIKIDKSFMLQASTSHQAVMIIRAVASLGRNLGIPVLAEGVETAEHVALLAQEGCDEAQGYYYGMPMELPSHGDLDRAIL
ncbi:bifunctional diguanylate cyclase/phosphodiesterase [Novosphingobium rosa]|uniref:bifunctional diguanylate cyclase/phosphodiesterase n=1 Tax=Novosphingobium rosa TaxID=76978 RepID=UPI00082B3318|nr:EAL domain-containing protein [Novosphingobium rosa]